MNSILKQDIERYPRGGPPSFQKWFRKAQIEKNPLLKKAYKIIFWYLKGRNQIDLYVETNIGSGLYFCHPYCITINPSAVLGKNINIHKGVTIGQENYEPNEKKLTKCGVVELDDHDRILSMEEKPA